MAVFHGEGLLLIEITLTRVNHSGFQWSQLFQFSRTEEKRGPTVNVMSMPSQKAFLHTHGNNYPTFLTSRIASFSTVMFPQRRPSHGARADTTNSFFRYSHSHISYTALCHPYHPSPTWPFIPSLYRASMLSLPVPASAPQLQPPPLVRVFCNCFCIGPSTTSSYTFPLVNVLMTRLRTGPSARPPPLIWDLSKPSHSNPSIPTATICQRP